MSNVLLPVPLVTRLKAPFGPFARAALAAPEGRERRTTMARMAAARGVAAKFDDVAAMKHIEAWRFARPGWAVALPPLEPLTEDEKAALKAELAAL